MFSDHTTFIGIDPTAGERPFTYVALDQDRSLLAVSQGDMEEVLAFVAGQRSAIVAVCAPYSPNRGLMDREEVRERLSPPPRPGRWRNFRLVEYQLRRHNIYIPQTAALEKDCPRWMQQGFILYKRLKALNYHPYPQKEAAHQYLEVYPHACFSVLLEHLPFPKHSLEGRIQRQLVLYKYDLNIPDPMFLFEEITRHRLLQGVLPIEDLYQVEELDAMVAAYTAWKAGMFPDEVTFLGDPSEGRLVIPTPDMKSRY
jgi:predicted RNase H-like nuclease